MVNNNYLLDTNVIIQILREDKNIIKRVYDVGVENCCISEITVAELYYGAVKGNRKSNFDDINIITEMFDVVRIYDCFEQLARIRLDLKNRGKLVDAYDMMIGATAVYHGYTLITHNTRHYENMQGIIIEDWQR